MFSGRNPIDRLKTFFKNRTNILFLLIFLLVASSIGLNIYNTVNLQKKIDLRFAELVLTSPDQNQGVKLAEYTDVKLGADAPFLGDNGAKVLMVEYGDFQCPYCGNFFKNTESQIISKYVKTGKVKFVYQSYAILGPESQMAAEASKCAQDQGKFWEYHDILFKNQKGENLGAFSNDNLKKLANAINLNQADFNNCLTSHKHEEKIKQETAAGQGYGVNGTPSFFINGKFVSGAVPLIYFENTIEAALKK